MTQTIKLTETELKKIINESVKRVLNEVSYNTAKEAFKKAYDRARGGETDRQRKQRNNLHQHFVERSGQNFDPNMPVVIVGGDLQGQYTAQEIVDKFDVTGFVEPSPNAIYADSKIIGYPHIKHYIGPMWDGDRIRYESQDAYDLFSR
jgi:hypothetical protein